MIIIADSLTDYASYLEDKCQVVKVNHQLLSPKRPESGVDMTLNIIEGAKSIKPKLVECYKILNENLLQADLYQPILVNEFLPLDTRERRRYVDELPHGIPNTLCVFPQVTILGTHTMCGRFQLTLFLKTTIRLLTK